ncbi:MAG: DNA primase [Leptospiraceae bacterium]|nr:DNA primase [Leptospiraceae bacterium]MCK6380068.1 DNA primase [Leptospiraceae bacterium]NUM42750.1 DNA primase [Leptospiraceae bacterium]
MSTSQEFDILKLVELTRANKYEMTSVGFAALDKIDKIELPKKMRTRKFAVQALHALSEKLVQYGYFSIEERKKLLAEANLSDSPYKKDFAGSSKSLAPVVEEVAEEEDIPEEESKPVRDFSLDDEDNDNDETVSEEDSFEDEDEDSEEDE